MNYWLNTFVKLWLEIKDGIIFLSSSVPYLRTMQIVTVNRDFGLRYSLVLDNGSGNRIEPNVSAIMSCPVAKYAKSLSNVCLPFSILSSVARRFRLRCQLIITRWTITSPRNLQFNTPRHLLHNYDLNLIPISLNELGVFSRGVALFESIKSFNRN